MARAGTRTNIWMYTSERFVWNLTRLRYIDFQKKLRFILVKEQIKNRWICICLSERDFSTSFLFQNRNSRCEIFHDRKDIKNFCCFSLLFGKWAMNHRNCATRTCCMNLKDGWWQASQMYLICVRILKIAPVIHKLSISYLIQNKIPFIYVVSILMIQNFFPLYINVT